MHEIRWAPSAAQIARAMNRFESLDLGKTALVVVDMQRGYIDDGFPGCCPHARDVLANINRLARAFRARGGLVIHTRHTILDDPDRGPPAWQRELAWLEPLFKSLEPGAEGHRLHPDLDVQPSDLVLDKVRYSAFLPISSSLDADLRARGIDTVIITGTVTNACCESSARDAHMMGYKVFFVADGAAAMTDEAHNGALASLGFLFADVRRTEEMLQLIAAA